ncbi:TetR/AcrR family transcriptional regulator [Egicoccus sp. AB-alg6-2]|uniref:TetR/AcrR family transcriptional regulator n=1 Tax=Egicoccus sp. AB-alg6-2 TaxID=3242692 RepID=UPI00359DE0C2
MGASPEKSTRRRPLSRDRVLRTAAALADEHGLATVTMRNLAQSLGVEAMSLYHHVPGKEALLDGLVEVVVDEINAAVPPVDDTGADGWHAALRARVLAAREVLLRHPWAPQLIATRSTISPAVMRYFDGVLALLRAGGFSWDLAHHALHALGSRAMGFTQELFAPDDVDADTATMAELERFAAQVPHLAQMLAEVTHDDPGTTLGWCDDQAEFEFGLDVLLDGLARRLERG